MKAKILVLGVFAFLLAGVFSCVLPPELQLEFAITEIRDDVGIPIDEPYSSIPAGNYEIDIDYYIRNTSFTTTLDDCKIKFLINHSGGQSEIWTIGYTLGPDDEAIGTRHFDQGYEIYSIYLIGAGFANPSD